MIIKFVTTKVFEFENDLVIDLAMKITTIIYLLNWI